MKAPVLHAKSPKASRSSRQGQVDALGFRVWGLGGVQGLGFRISVSDVRLEKHFGN